MLDPLKSAVKYTELLRPDGVLDHGPVAVAFEANVMGTAQTGSSSASTA